MSVQSTENGITSSPHSEVDQRVFERVQPSATTCSMSPVDEERSLRGSRSTRSSLTLPGPESVPEFKRVRTKFTADQMRELETLFTVFGPHPTREQRLAVSEKINVPPRTVQVFLQNRRQRDTKNRTAVDDAEAAKKEAKEQTVTSTSKEFKFTVPKSTNAAPSSQKELSEVTNMLKARLSRPSLASTTRANVPEQSRSIRPCTPHNVSLDRIAERKESIRPSYEWKENIPSDPLSSPITEALDLDEYKSPMKRIQFTPPPPTALWTRMISSPPTPLSPTNRRDDWRRINRVKSAGKFHNLELACALSRGPDRRSEDKATLHLEPNPPVRVRTISSQKRLREDVETDIPRKRASIINFHQLTGSNACPKPKERYPEQRQGIVRGSFETDSSGGTTTGDEFATPEDSIAPSSPSVACQSDSSMLKIMGSIEESQSILEQGLVGGDKTVDTLSRREADAAMVLASLFGQA